MIKFIKFYFGCVFVLAWMTFGMAWLPFFCAGATNQNVSPWLAVGYTILLPAWLYFTVKKDEAFIKYFFGNF